MKHTNDSLHKNSLGVNARPHDQRRHDDPRVLYSLLVPRLLTDEEAEAELQDLIDGIEDQDFFRRGC